ncbi:hypothetical protein [Prosthecobacter sp.]|jgi:hypothetical protein|uniref:hypothetical protein n=1 Tax=Prosthecobacter sp. TaxID=1965333 RepID=UPI0037C90E43
MSTKRDKIAVVVTGPETKDATMRAFELQKQNVWVAEFKKHFVFAMPRDYGAQKGREGIPEMEFENSELWDKGPTGKFTWQEASVIANVSLSRWFVFVSKISKKGGIPKVGYCYDLRDWSAVKRYDPKTPESAFDYPQYFGFDVCRALRITINEQKRDFSICPVVMSMSFLASHDCHMVRVGTWQRRLWDDSAGLIPDSETIPFSKFNRFDQETKEYPNLGGKIKMVDRLRFLRCHLFQHWENNDIELKNRSHHISLITGQTASTTGNFRNELGDAGCKNPSPSIAKRMFDSLRIEARQFLATTDSDEVAKWKAQSLLAASSNDHLFNLLSVVYPEEFGKILASG